MTTLVHCTHSVTGRIARAVGLALLMLAPAVLSQSEETPTNGERAPVDLETRRQAVENDASLPEDVKTRALELYTRADDSKRQLEETLVRLEALKTRTGTAPAMDAEAAEMLSGAYDVRGRKTIPDKMPVFLRPIRFRDILACTRRAKSS